MVQVGDSQAVVVKPLAMSAVAEALATAVANIVGVRVADSRVVSVQDEEFFNMVAALGNAPTMRAEDQSRFCSMRSKEFAAIVEFVPGPVLQGVEGQRALGGDTSGRILEGVGALVALDCLLNNMDRVPAIWSNEGNFSNIMVLGGGSVVGIDQQVYPIADAQGRERYLSALRGFCEDVNYLRVDGAPAQRVKIAFLENCGIELSPEQCRHFLAGASTAFRRISGQRDVLLAELAIVGAQMARRFSHPYVDVGLGRLGLMVEFIGSCLDVVSEEFA